MYKRSLFWQLYPATLLVALLALADLVSTRLYFGRIEEHYRLEETRLKAELERRKEEGRRMKDEG